MDRYEYRFDTPLAPLGPGALIIHVVPPRGRGMKCTVIDKTTGAQAEGWGSTEDEARRAAMSALSLAASGR